MCCCVEFFCRLLLETPPPMSGRYALFRWPQALSSLPGFPESLPQRWNLAPGAQVLFVHQPEGELQAVTSWMPVWREGELIGRTLDFMRRADGAMPGVMEFAIASAALHMKDQGLQVMSLSGAPLAQTVEGGEDEVAVRVHPEPVHASA